MPDDTVEYITPAKIRFIERDGKRILQQESVKIVTTFIPMANGLYFAREKERYWIWRDVPFVTEKEE